MYGGVGALSVFTQSILRCRQLHPMGLSLYISQLSATMGNKVAKDFQAVRIGKGHLTAANSERNAVVPGTVVLKAEMTITVKKDGKKKSIEFFDASEPNPTHPLFVSTLTKGESMSSVTVNSKGKVLFVSKAPDKATRLIFKASDDTEIDMTSSQPSSIGGDDNDFSPVARIEIDYVAESITAFLSVKIKRSKCPQDMSSRSESASECSESLKSGGSGAGSRAYSRSGSTADSRTASQASIEMRKSLYVDLYKAVKIPGVKYGVLIVDMRGQIVGKSAQESKSAFPVIIVAPGSDASAIVALACVINGDL